MGERGRLRHRRQHHDDKALHARHRQVPSRYTPSDVAACDPHGLLVAPRHATSRRCHGGAPPDIAQPRWPDAWVHATWPTHVYRAPTSSSAAESEQCHAGQTKDCSGCVCVCRLVCTVGAMHGDVQTGRCAGRAHDAVLAAHARSAACISHRRRRRCGACDMRTRRTVVVANVVAAAAAVSAAFVVAAAVAARVPGRVATRRGRKCPDTLRYEPRCVARLAPQMVHAPTTAVRRCHGSALAVSPEHCTADPCDRRAPWMARVAMRSAAALCATTRYSEPSLGTGMPAAVGGSCPVREYIVLMPTAHAPRDVTALPCARRGCGARVAAPPARSLQCAHGVIHVQTDGRATQRCGRMHVVGNPPTRAGPLQRACAHTQCVSVWSHAVRTPAPTRIYAACSVGAVYMSPVGVVQTSHSGSSRRQQQRQRQRRAAAQRSRVTIGVGSKTGGRGTIACVFASS